ncbi:MAG TPA: DUF2283 domain-containing protein [Paraburkholderia sp.]|uniref:DUF2283 domain-containing protein n=1 Tax=Paraburkholderia sp. TaxID=1926495 RepID=UPI002B4A0DC6|nr:DUF2283 domain-containing protein [Paraburkholderia sp.]HKR40305.1 DUF2283 domain-containing protein [Paraburkholderia sp.]
MKIRYDDKDDILHIEFSSAPVVRDVSQSWHLNLGYSETGLAELTILDAKANGYWPIASSAPRRRAPRP